MIKFKNTDYRLLVLPQLELWYVKGFFVNEEQNKNALGFNIGWLFWELYIMIKL
jgi:hypothetical protein